MFNQSMVQSGDELKGFGPTVEAPRFATEARSVRRLKHARCEGPGCVTLFEYLSVATSIVLSLSVTQVLSSLRAVFHSGRRYWVHAIWTVLVLILHLIIWWAFWAYRDVESWNLATFALVLFNPGVLFVASNTLVNREPNVESWAEHYFAIRRPFFATFGLIPLGTLLRDGILFGTPVLIPGHLPEAFTVIISVVGWSSESRRIHALLAPTFLLAIVGGAAYVWFQPGGVAS